MPDEVVIVALPRWAVRWLVQLLRMMDGRDSRTIRALFARAALAGYDADGRICIRRAV